MSKERKWRYRFPRPVCGECPDVCHEGVSKFCCGFPNRAPRRFRSSDPTICVPKWCPKCIAPIARIYEIKDDQSFITHTMLRDMRDYGAQKYVEPYRHHYILRNEIKLPSYMTAKRFYESTQSDGICSILSEVNIELCSVIEIDDGLKPYRFYVFGHYKLILMPDYCPGWSTPSSRSV